MSTIVILYTQEYKKHNYFGPHPHIYRSPGSGGDATTLPSCSDEGIPAVKKHTVADTNRATIDLVYLWFKEIHVIKSTNHQDLSFII